MATKDQVLALQTQANSIEQQLRDTKIEVRLPNRNETANQYILVIPL
jgi:hypothetical protein